MSVPELPFGGPGPVRSLQFDRICTLYKPENYMTLRIQIPPNRVGLIVKKSHPQNRIVGEVTFLGQYC